LSIENEWGNLNRENAFCEVIYRIKGIQSKQINIKKICVENYGDMRRISGLIVVFVLLISTMSWAEINISMPDTVVDQGEEVTLPVMVTDVTGFNVISYQIELSYNSQIVNPIEVSNVNSISGDWANLFYNLEIGGEISIAAFDTNPLAGEGALIYVTFQVIGEPKSETDIVFDFVEISGDTTNIVKENGRIKVKSNTVMVTIDTDKPEVKTVLVDGEEHESPHIVEWIRGTEHTIEAVADVVMDNGFRYIFNSWSDRIERIRTVSTDVDTTFIAQYSTQYYLQLISEHGNAEGEGWYDMGATANFTVESEVVEGGDTKHLFKSWRSESENGYNGKLRNATVIMENPITEIVEWETEYRIDIRSDHGSTFGSGWYSNGALVTCGIDTLLIEDTGSRYQFQSWRGTGEDSYSGEEPEFNLIVNSPVFERAVWDSSYYVEFVAEPVGILELSGSDWYSSGDLVTSDIAPDTIVTELREFYLKGWSLNGTQLEGNPVEVRVDSAMKFVARYGYPVMVTVTTNIGEGTKVIVDSIEYNAPYTFEWMSFDEHRLYVPDYQGEADGCRYAFTAWNVGGPQEQVISPESDGTYMAVLRTQYFLDIATEPEGLFNLKGSQWYNAGYTVNLNSAPSIGRIGDQTYRFVYWRVNEEEIYENPVSIDMHSAMLVRAHYDSCYSISGTVYFDDAGMEDVRIILGGSYADTVFTNRKGEYKFSALLRGDYTITPVGEEYIFDPEFVEVSDLHINITEQDFSMRTVTSMSKSDEKLKPETFEVFQNYPNPFNSSTNIKFHVPEETYIKINIYNILGVPVRTLMNDVLDKGDHLVSWHGCDQNGNAVPSGLYIYKIDTGDQIFVNKMILLE